MFAGWQTAALKAHRKPLLWPWPWGACWGSGLGPGVPAGQGVWRVWTVLESARRVWRVLEGLEGFGGWSDRTSSTPAVVPGAAPALAKAGVGGFSERACILEHQIFRFAKMILRDRCTLYDLASHFVAGAALLTDGVEKSQNALVRGRQLCIQLILEGSLAELFRS